MVRTGPRRERARAAVERRLGSRQDVEPQAAGADAASDRRRPRPPRLRRRPGRRPRRKPRRPRPPRRRSPSCCQRCRRSARRSSSPATPRRSTRSSWSPACRDIWSRSISRTASSSRRATCCSPSSRTSTRTSSSRPRRSSQAAKAARDHAHLEVGRYTALSKQHAASQVEVDHWVFEEKTAEANISAAQAQVALAKLNLGYTEVTAPFDGQMGRHLVDPDNMVGGDGRTARARRDHAARPDLRRRQHQLAAGAADPRQPRPAPAVARRTAQGPDRGGACPTRPAFRIAARSNTSPRRSTRRPARSICAASCTTPTGRCCPACSSTSACRWARSPRAPCSFPQIALQEDQGGRYLFVVGDGDVVQKRYVQLGDVGRRPAGRDQRRQSRRPDRRRRALAGDARA